MPNAADMQKEPKRLACCCADHRERHVFITEAWIGMMFRAVPGGGQRTQARRSTQGRARVAYFVGIAFTRQRGEIGMEAVHLGLSLGLDASLLQGDADCTQRLVSFLRALRINDDLRED
jgi:hypothetical protein